MGASEVSLGGRLPLVDPGTLEGEQKALYAQMKTTLVSWATANGFKGETADGKLIGPFNPFLHSVGITPAVWRSRVGQFFTAEPDVSHTELVAAYF